MAIDSGLIVHYGDDGPEAVGVKQHLQHSYQPQPDSPVLFPKSPEITPRKRICGLQPRTFWLILGLVIITIGASVGGGIGGSLVLKNKSSKTVVVTSTISSPNYTPTGLAKSRTTSSSSFTSSSTTSANIGIYTALAAAFVSEVPLPCSQTPIQSTFNASAYFMMACGVDFQGGDIAGTIAYSFSDCLEACVSRNRFAKGGDLSCTTITFRSAMASEVEKEGANCWLKHSAQFNAITDTGSVGAKLCEDSTCSQSVT